MEKIGKYEIGEPIGSGSLGTDYRSSTEDGLPVAIKIFHPHIIKAKGFVRRFKKEAELAKKLSHPNSVKILEYGRHDGNYFIVMELVEGKSLAEILKERGLETEEPVRSALKNEDAGTAREAEARQADQDDEDKLQPEGISDRDRTILLYMKKMNEAQQKQDAPAREAAVEEAPPDPVTAEIRKKVFFTPAETIRIMQQIAAALEASEKVGLIHCDIKPRNIIIDNQGNVKLIGFGLAKDTEDLNSILVNASQPTLGLQYLSPEQICGHSRADIRSDLYSIGAVGYHMLAGSIHLPDPQEAFYGIIHILTKVNKSVTPDLAKIIGRLIDRDPGRRYQTPAGLMEDLDRVMNGENPLPLTPVPQEKGRRKTIRILLWCSTAAISVFLLLLFLSLSSSSNPDSEEIVDKAVARAHVKLTEKKYDDAIAELENVIGKFKDKNPEIVREAVVLLDYIPQMHNAYMSQKEVFDRRIQDEEAGTGRKSGHSVQGNNDYGRKAAEAAKNWADANAKIQSALSDARNSSLPDSRHFEAVTLAVSVLENISSQSKYLSAAEKLEIADIRSGIALAISKLVHVPEGFEMARGFASNTGGWASEIIHKPTGIEMIYVVPGEFMMGSPASDGDRGKDEVQHAVKISNSYYIGKFEITQGQWEKVMGVNPSFFKDAGKNAPVETVSWNDCQIFCGKIGPGFRMPTEAEWEYACRGGNSSKGFIYSGGSNLDEVGWFSWNSGTEIIDEADWSSEKLKSNKCRPHLVGQKRPNELGLYDMSGNVWEWCSDWYGEYPAGGVTDPQGPPSGIKRVGRGGCWWYCKTKNCRSSFRYWFDPDYRWHILGFRLVLDIPKAKPGTVHQP